MQVVWSYANEGRREPTGSDDDDIEEALSVNDVLQ